MASRSRLAAEHDHEWFAVRPRKLFTLVEIENPTMTAGLGASPPGLSQQRWAGHGNDGKSQEDNPLGHERSPSAGFLIQVRAN